MELATSAATLANAPGWPEDFTADSFRLNTVPLGRPGSSYGMRPSLKQKVVEICEAKINHKGEGGGLSFYALFANKNDDPELLMEAATWWIKTHRLDHFEKSIKDSTLASGRGVKIHPHKIVKSLPALSQDMGIGCIIGVEASEEPAILRRLGGVLVQGYSHSPPASETVRLLPIEGSARRTA